MILHGDCLTHLNALPEQSVDLIFADPPYNLQLRGSLLRPNETVVDAVDDDWDQFESFAAYDHFTADWLRACRRVLKDTGTIWVIGSYHNIFRVGNTLMNLGYWILNDVIWQKVNPMPNFRGTRFTNATETLIWAKKSQEQTRYTFNYHAMKHLNEDKQMQNIWYIPVCRGAERVMIGGQKAHPTQKPEALLYRIITAASNPGDTVLDPFLGSGTSGAVAKKLKRRFIGIERDPLYVEIAQQRLDAIPEPDIPYTVLETPSRRKLPRVKFGLLLEAQYLAPGQILYSEDRQHSAVIQGDSHLVCGEHRGSIHQVAAAVLGKQNHNGWDYWHYEDTAGNLHSIDALRGRYREEYMLQ